MITPPEEVGRVGHTGAGTENSGMDSVIDLIQCIRQFTDVYILVQLKMSGRNRVKIDKNVPVNVVLANPELLCGLFPAIPSDSEMAITWNSYLVPGASPVTLKSLLVSL